MTRLFGLLIAFYLPLQLPADVALDRLEIVADGETQPVADPAIPDPSPAASNNHSRFSGRPPPKVQRRQHTLTFYPCAQCHKFWKTNPVPHELAPVHRVGLNHGQDRFWCLTCHDDENRDLLRTERDGKISFDESWRLCGQCHANRQKDWYFGAHGKRINGWQGEAERYNCTHCHNPHFPPFEAKAPQPKPPIRAGLAPMKKQNRPKPNLWERHGTMNQETNVD